MKHVIYFKMMTGYLKILIVFFLIIVSSSTSFSYEAHFSDQKEFTGWEIKGSAKSIRFKDGVLIIRGSDVFRLYSPDKLGIPQRKALFELSLKSTEEDILAYATFKTESGETFKKSFLFLAPYRFNTYIIDLSEIRKSKTRIDSFYLSFSGVDEVEIDYIHFRETSFFYNSINSIKNFMKASDIRGLTINDIYTPSFGNLSMMTVLYVLFFLFFIFFVIIFWLSGKKIDLKLSFILSGIIISILFVGRMDYKWAFVWLNDTNIIKDSERTERVSILKGGDLNKLANTLKQIVPKGEKVKIIANEDFFILRMRYFLLPMLVSEDANYVLVDDRRVRYIPEENSILMGKTILESDVELLGSFENGSLLYKKISPLVL